MLTEIFIFRFLCGSSKGFMKAFKGFIKPFEAPQRSVKIKMLIFSLCQGLGQQGLSLIIYLVKFLCQVFLSMAAVRFAVFIYMAVIFIGFFKLSFQMGKAIANNILVCSVSWLNLV